MARRDLARDNPLNTALTLGAYAALVVGAIATRNERLISTAAEVVRASAVSGDVSGIVNRELAGSTVAQSQDIFKQAARSSSPDTVRIPSFAFNAAGEKRPTWLEQRRDSPLAKMYAKNSESVVLVLKMDGSKVFGTGSGLFVDADGLAATNFHVAANSPVLAIETSSRQRFYVQPIARDVDADLALLRIVGKPEGVSFAPVKLGNTGSLREGSLLTAIGHPDGVEQEVLSFGSFKGTALKYQSSNFNARSVGTNISDIPIKPGYSGSGVFAEDNSVVSIVTATNDITNGRVGYGTSVEHLKVLLDEVRRRRPLNTWLDVQSNFENGLHPRASSINVSERSATSMQSDWSRMYREKMQKHEQFSAPDSLMRFINQEDRPN